MKLKKVIFYALSCAALSGISMTAAASELPISSFYSCDLDSREVVNYDIEVPTDTVDELIMQGSFGNVDSELSSVQGVGVSQKKAENGWFNDENGTYYRLKNGRLCKKEWKKIGKYYYSFDSEGKMQTGKVKLSNGRIAYFNAKNGRYRYDIMNLTITKKAKAYIEAKSSYGPFYISTGDVTVVNKAGKKIAAGKLKKNSKIQVLYQGGFLETSPMTFEKIVRIKKVS